MPVSGNLAKWQTRSIITVGSVDFPYTRKIRGLSLKLKKFKTFYFATIIDSQETAKIKNKTNKQKNARVFSTHFAPTEHLA